MRHPFAGIIVPQAQAQQPTPSRREVLSLLVGVGAASMVAGVAAAEGPTDIAIDKEGQLAEPPAEAVAEQKYHLYYVVPKEVRLFDARRRMDLNIRGEMLPGLAQHKDLADKPGFLAWLDDAEAAKVKAADDVTLAHAMTPADVMVQGKPPEKGVATLRVFAAPLGWRNLPPRESYLNMAELGKLWGAKFAMKDGVTVVANETVRQPFLQFAEGKVAADVLEELKAQPQVYALQWLTPMAVATRRVGEDGIVTTDALREEAATTLALGEEGATTGAIGEEGGVTTRAEGEEGGVTTFAIGEEGASTRALGEEGGVSTRARGEEGGASTEALGEEGGGISTKALGEEGGKEPRPMPLPERPRVPGLSTQRDGEEGGDFRIERPKPPIE